MNLNGEQWASAVFKPVVLVIASGKAEALCQKNGLQLAQLLKPFGARISRGQDVVRFRTPNQGVKVVTSYGVQMVSPEEMNGIAQTSPASLDQILRHYEPGDNRMCDDVSEISDAARFFRRHPDPTPWFTEYRLQLHKSLGFAPHEFTEQPIGMILAIASDEEAPGKKLAHMSAQGNLPKPIAEGFLDSDIPCAYWILHDNDNKDTTKATELLKEIEKRYPVSCKLITLNSGKPDEPVEDIWKSYLDPSIQKDSKRRGQYLSADDLKLLASTVSEFVLKVLNPHLERKLNILNAEVNHARKGLSNTIKFMFGARKSAKQGRLHSGTGYDLKSIEAKVRQAADFALLISDYDTAAGHYRIAKSDYQHDKLTKLLAGANELHGLCAMLVGGVRNGSSYIENAIKWYQTNADMARATRATLWAVDAYRTQGISLEAAEILKRASERESHFPGGSQLRAALLLEQAAYMYLRPSKQGVQIRKYAFHLIMAGHMYHKCRYHRHGIRCYKSARCVYRNKRWFHAQDHIDYDLAKHLSQLKDTKEALKFFSSSLDFVANPNPFVTGLQKQKDIDEYSPADEKMRLANEKQIIKYVRAGPQQEQPPERQAIFFSDLKTLVDKAGEGGIPVPRLNLPLVLDSEVKVILDVGCTISAEISSLAWSSVLFAAVPLSDKEEIVNKPLIDRASLAAKAKPEDRFARMGEPVKVMLQLENPLHSQLKISSMRLISEISIDGKKPVTCSEELEDDHFTRTEIDLNMAPKSFSTVALSVTAKRTGTIYITGVQWRLNQNIIGSHAFNLPSELLIKSTSTGRKKAIRKRNASLEVPVKPAAALMDVELEGVPDVIYHNQIISCSIKLMNIGQLPTGKGVQIKISHPLFMVLTSMDGKVLEYDERGLVSVDLEVKPGEETTLRMWLRAAKVGNQSLNWMLRYSFTDDASKLQYRVAYLTKALKCLPLMHLDISSRPSIRFSESDSSLVLANMRNVTSKSRSPLALTIKLEHVAMISNLFTVSKFDMDQKYILQPEESHNLVLRVSEGKESQGSGQELYDRKKRLSTVPLSTEKTDINPAIWKLLGMEGYLKTVELKRKIMLNPNAYKNAGKELFEGNIKDFDLLVCWSSTNVDTKTPINGYHLLRDQTCLNSLHSKNSSACPLKVMVQHPQSIKHDFSSGRLRVPTKIQVCNRRDDIAVSFIFETLAPTQVFDSITRSFQESKNHSMNARYFWAGLTSQRIKNLEPNKQILLEIDAVFHSAGEYNLNRFRFSVDMPGVGIKHFFFPLQHLISIENASRQ